MRRVGIPTRAWRSVVHPCAWLLVTACGGSTVAVQRDASAEDGGSNQAGIVQCGASQCRAVAGEACCGSSSASSGPFCSTSCPADGRDVTRCDGPEDCPGQKCCYRGPPDGHSEASCRSDCPWGNGLELCHGDTECVDVSVPGATKCCPASSTYPGLGVCDFPDGGVFCTP
jgi:hypothetical protein